MVSPNCQVENQRCETLRLIRPTIGKSDEEWTGQMGPEHKMVRMSAKSIF
jgi:hypothetical protein